MNINIRSWLIHLVLAGCFVLLMMVLPYFPQYFVYGNSIVFLAMLLSLVFLKREQTFLAGCLVVPLAIMVSLSASKMPASVRVILYYGTFLSVGLSYAREYIYIKFHLFTLPRLDKMVFFSVLGILMGVGISQLLLVTNQIVPEQLTSLFSWKELIAILPIMAIGEEIVFRRVIQNESEKLVPSYASIVITSILYAVLFAPLGGFFVFISYNISLLLGILYLLNRRIAITGITSLGIKIGCILGLLIFHG